MNDNKLKIKVKETLRKLPKVKKFFKTIKRVDDREQVYERL